MAKKERIDKILSNLGYGTRKELKKIIRDGSVTVNGETVKDSGFKLDPDKDAITIYDEEVYYKEHIYLMLNKPAGYISATEDYLHDTVLDLIEDKDKVFDIFPVGRLDKDTEGLLILTNDGQLAHRVLSPRRHVKKLYYAEIQGEVGEEDSRLFSEGVVLDDGYKTLPARLEILSSGDVSEINVEIVEGKYHQVKRMFEAVDKSVIYLKRMRMGELELDPELEYGEYREITPEEIELLQKQ